MRNWMRRNFIKMWWKSSNDPSWNAYYGKRCVSDGIDKIRAYNGTVGRPFLRLSYFHSSICCISSIWHRNPKKFTLNSPSAYWILKVSTFFIIMLRTYLLRIATASRLAISPTLSTEQDIVSNNIMVCECIIPNSWFLHKQPSFRESWYSPSPLQPTKSVHDVALLMGEKNVRVWKFVQTK